MKGAKKFYSQAVDLLEDRKAFLTSDREEAGKPLTKRPQGELDLEKKWMNGDCRLLELSLWLNLALVELKLEDFTKADMAAKKAYALDGSEGTTEAGKKAIYR